MTKTILIVEDNELNMKLFCDLLESQGYFTLPAFSGMAALQSASAHDCSLIILDIQLPDMSGLDVVRVIKSNPSLNDLPILAVTAFAMRGDEEKILAAGCDAYCPKPIEVTEFLSTVKRLLDRPGSQPDNGLCTAIPIHSQ